MTTDLKKQLNSIIRRSKKAFSFSLSTPPSRLSLLTFDSPNCVERWQLRTDQTIGGNSEASLSFSPETNAITFSGTLSLTVPENKDMVKSGFANIVTRISAFDVDDIDYYDSIELLVKHDDRGFAFNISTENMVPYHLHQAFLNQKIRPQVPMNTSTVSTQTIALSDIKESTYEDGTTRFDRYGDISDNASEGFQWVKLSFDSDFVLTWLGMVQGDQPELNIRRLEALGITLADKTEGPFSVSIKAIDLVKTQLK
eukprot:TRINITY_DN3794_c0_g1_i1.p1 TRINITY_DN3794_c0_g1~~TRINITY_DN3794_c0_g1_i1.p1  ORF type:complete len:255 (+),score=64.62 TRINITY_DN3794_c0_g1_i1:363-1127(+)